MEQLILDNFCKDDLPSILIMLNDKENAKFRMATKTPSSLQDCADWISWYKNKENQNYYLFAIRNIKNREIIGFCTAKPYLQESKCFEIGIQINKLKRNGIGVLAILKLQENLRNKHKNIIFCANIRKDNIAAQKLFTKLGYIHTKTHVDRDVTMCHYVKKF